jgi:hypothetical protein
VEKKLLSRRLESNASQDSDEERYFLPQASVGAQRQSRTHEGSRCTAIALMAGFVALEYTHSAYTFLCGEQYFKESDRLRVSALAKEAFRPKLD